MTNFDGFKVAHLAGHGFSAELVAAWAAAGLTELLPLQAQAVMTTGLLRGENIVALGPTSAGKTFVGELAAARHWEAGRKTIFLSPTRALVAEQYRHLKTRYSGLGVRVMMSTADHSRDDGRIRRGDFDFGVMVYEKLRALLVSAPDMLYSIGAVVADELQILGEGDRGETADLLLTRLTRAEPRVQVIGLSAVVNNGDRLAQWLDAELVTSSVRPAELREGIFCLEHQAFHYKTAANDAGSDEWIWPDGEAIRAGTEDSGCPGVIEMCTALARRGEACLVFVPTRAMSRQLCGAIATELGLSGTAAAEPTWNELREAEDSLARRQLMECVPAGVAFHNSDLTAELRLMVERGFNDGRLRVLVATPTLAQGVNLRAANVIQVPLMLRGDASAATRSSGSFVALSVGRYRNQAGRAGRVGSGVEFGRSIMIAQGHQEAARLMRTYVQAKPEPVSRNFSEHSMEHFTLECVQSGLAETYSGIHKALEHTFAWHCGAVAPGNALEDALSEAIRSLLDLQLLDETSGHRLRLTGSGQAMAAGGFRSATMRELMAVCRDWMEAPPRTFEVLCACAFTADGESFPLVATPSEMKANVWVRSARRIIEQEGGLRSHELRRLIEPAGGLALAGHSSLKKAVIAHGWISATSTTELEERLRTVAGTIGSLAAHLAWIGGGLGACASVLQCADSLSDRIKAVVVRLPQGLAEEAAGLANLQMPGLTRCYLNRLGTEGYGTVRELKTALGSGTSKLLESIVPQALMSRLMRSLYQAPEPIVSHEENVPRTAGTIAYEQPALPTDLRVAESLRTEFADQKDRERFDLVLDAADPGFVRFHGAVLRLPPKPYALLTLLAQRCGRTVPYREIDEIVWPDEKVEPQQISAHKSTLIRELARVSCRERAEAAIVTDARFGLRLDLPRERVSLNGAGRSDIVIRRQAQPGSAPLGIGL